MNKEIAVTKNNCSYSELLLLVDYIVTNSFGKGDGEYHEYLKDFYTALVVLTNFTDYQSDLKDNELADEVMDIAYSSEWERICNEIQIYDKLARYVRYEVKNRTRPLVKIENVIDKGNKLINMVAEKISAIDVEELKNAIEQVNVNAGNITTTENVDNVKQITDYMKE